MPLLGSILHPLRTLRRAFKKETYIVKLPAGMTLEQAQKFVNRVYLEDNKRLKAENIRFKAKDEEKKRAVQRKKGEEAIKGEIVRFNIAQRKKKYKNTIGFRMYVHKDGEWKPLDKLPTFFLKSERPFYKIAGYFMQQTPDGYVHCLPWIRSKKKDAIFKEPAPDFFSFFRKKMGMVSQLKGGKLDSNFDIDRYKKPLFKPSGQYTRESNPGEKVRIIDMSEQQRKELEDKIAQLKKQTGEMYSELEKRQRVIDGQDKRELEHSIIRSASEEKAEAYATTVSTLGKEIPELARAVADSLGALSSMTIKQRVGEKSAFIILDALKKKEELMRDRLSKEDRDVIKDQMKTDLDDMVELQNKLTKGRATKEDIEKILKMFRGGATKPGGK